ncbi:hypothetical protein FB382_001148 [Nocardioides ginsengisegetis]|uniref:Uncharacterized protein n=1 Tax=Nocardioides ginsengisegetis TaxID=661491 RepID=A0A7W3P8Y0_9ACTN|nr:hypothetical protein [Nocardioides ginsengisegetis]MBA8802857.1 hypothetical protein [Nocardioides ginsengisegetis]
MAAPVSSTPASAPVRGAVAWFVGFVLGLLVNLAGVAAFLAGAGLWVYWVLLVVAVMVGAAAWMSRRGRWFGVGLVTGCVAELAIMVFLVLMWSHIAGNTVQ